MQLDAVTGGVMIVVASFAIDRIVTALLFVLSYTNVLPTPALIEEPTARTKAQRSLTAAYFVSAGILVSAFLLYYENARVMEALNLHPANQVLDFVVTAIVILGGADRVAALLQTSGATATPEPAAKPIEITGRLVLGDGEGRHITGS